MPAAFSRCFAFLDPGPFLLFDLSGARLWTTCLGTPGMLIASCGAGGSKLTLVLVGWLAGLPHTNFLRLQLTNGRVSLVHCWHAHRCAHFPVAATSGGQQSQPSIGPVTASVALGMRLRASLAMAHKLCNRWCHWLPLAHAAALSQPAYRFPARGWNNDYLGPSTIHRRQLTKHCPLPPVKVKGGNSTHCQCATQCRQHMLKHTGEHSVSEASAKPVWS